MVIETSPSDRMQVRSLGELQHPASCMICGNGNCDDGYLDLGVFFDYEGTMYLCMTCARQAGETIGLYTPEEVKQIISHGEELATKVAELTSELEDARPAIDYLRRFTDTSAHAYGIALDPTVQVGEPEPERSLKLVGTSDSGESESEESTKSRESKPSSGTKPRNITFE